MKNKLSRSVDIIGVGITKLGLVTDTAEIKNMTGRELWTMAAHEAMQDAGVAPQDIDALVFGNMFSELSEDQFHLGNILVQWTGLSAGDEVWKPAVRIEGACASSSHSIREAVLAIASGVYDVVLAGGLEVTNAKVESRAPGRPRKMTNDERLKALWCHYDQLWEMPQLSVQDLIMCQWIIAYAKEYGLNTETLYDVLDARILSNAHNGQSNPKAYWNGSFEKLAAEAGLENARALLRSAKHNPLLYWPLRLFDGARRADAAAAVVLCSSEVSKQFQQKPVRVLGTGNAHSNTLSEKMYTQPFIREAARQAYDMADIGPGDVDIAEVYDYLAPEFIIPLEDMGYFGRGEAWQALLEKRTTFAGDKPVNLSGGSGAGSVVGCVGAIQSYYVVKQLRGEAGANQVKPTPRVGLVFDCGAARDAVIHLYGRE